MAAAEGCERFLGQVLAWLDGELEGQELKALEAHLRECSRCVACREILAKSVSLCSRKGEMPEEARRRILRAVRHRLDDKS